MTDLTYLTLVGLYSPNKEDVPDTLPGHFGWWMTYDELERPLYDTYYDPSEDGKSSTLSNMDRASKVSKVPRNKEVEMSHWGIAIFNHLVDGSLTNPKSMTGYQKISIFVKGHTSADFQDDSLEHLGLFTFFVYYCIMYWYVILTLVVITLIINRKFIVRIPFCLVNNANGSSTNPYQKLPQSESEMIPVR